LGPAGSRCDSAATTNLGEECDKTGRHLWLRKECRERSGINDFLTVIFIGRFEFPQSERGRTTGAAQASATAALNLAIHRRVHASHREWSSAGQIYAPERSAGAPYEYNSNLNPDFELRGDGR
jgi:hypothetical protein